MKTLAEKISTHHKSKERAETSAGIIVKRVAVKFIEVAEWPNSMKLAETNLFIGVIVMK